MTSQFVLSLSGLFISSFLLLIFFEKTILLAQCPFPLLLRWRRRERETDVVLKHDKPNGRG